MFKILLSACYLVALPILVFGKLGFIVTDAAAKVWHAFRERD